MRGRWAGHPAPAVCGANVELDNFYPRHMTQPTVGFVGAGQLARMAIQAAIPLDVRVTLLAATPDDGAALISPHVSFGSPSDEAAMRAFAATCDVITFDHELVDLPVLRRLAAAGATFRPGPDTVAVAQDKWLQHERFASAGLPLPPFALVESAVAIDRFAATHGWPLIAKAARGGYDGRGVWVLEGAPAGRALFDQIAVSSARVIVEQLVPIDREIAIMVARRPGGESVTYPVVETIQRDGICHELVVPAPVDDALGAEARSIGHTIADLLDVVGILAVELFVSNGRLLVNEIACRPHNSGHWSIEGAVTSQFENHLRAVLDWPLGDTDLTAPAVATANILGEPNTPPFAASLPHTLAIPGAHVHLYGKTPRPGRKLGHVTVTGADPTDILARAKQAAAILAGRA